MDGVTTDQSMITWLIDPISDSRWLEVLRNHPHSSIFHTPGWLDALRRTYGYDALVYVCGTDKRISSAWVFCRVKSWLTGGRLVSLPFSDHCDPLVSDAGEWEYLAHALRSDGDQGCDYVECRPRDAALPIPAEFRVSQKFCLHRLDLRPSLDELFNNLHKDSVQRKIRRAERERLTYEDGQSEDILDKFYELLIRTRRRHGLPPQPRKWFRNLISCMGTQLNIRVASKNAVPVASILTLRFNNTLIYKYGCSDERFFNLGGMQLLLWQAIADAKQSGAEELDLGRSETDDEGLLVFKDRWGARRSPLTYFRSRIHAPHDTIDARNWSSARRIVSRMPSAVLSTAGRLFYGHFG